MPTHATASLRHRHRHGHGHMQKDINVIMLNALRALLSLQRARVTEGVVLLTSALMALSGIMKRGDCDAVARSPLSLCLAVHAMPSFCDCVGGPWNIRRRLA